jgi:uncharacterized membrane protein
MRLFLILTFCAMCFPAFASRADASLTACNRTDANLTVATYRHWKSSQSSEIYSDGWTNLTPGSCGIVIDSDLRFFDEVGYYAYSSTTRFWSGDASAGRNLCINFQKPFKYFLAGDPSICPGAMMRLYRPLGFPPGQSDYSFNLIPPS